MKEDPNKSTPSSAFYAPQLAANGLLTNHCYSVVSAHEIQSAGRKIRLLKLRNPWGKEEWNGEWSESYSGWTPALRAQVAYSEGNNGIFCMPLDHYLAQFSTTNICKYNDDDIAFTIHKRKPVAQRTFFEFKLDQPHSLEILLNQMGDRLSRRRRKDGTQFEPSWFNMTLCQTEGQQNHQGTKVSLPHRFI